MPKPKTTSLKILTVLAENSPLSAGIIAKRLEANRKTIQALLGRLKREGLIQLYKSMRGIYTITENGKILLKQKEVN
jgi:Mn-dependent DtxR family transcriptional regulator